MRVYKSRLILVLSGASFLVKVVKIITIQNHFQHQVVNCSLKNCKIPEIVIALLLISRCFEIRTSKRLQIHECYKNICSQQPSANAQGGRVSAELSHSAFMLRSDRETTEIEIDCEILWQCQLFPRLHRVVIHPAFRLYTHFGSNLHRPLTHLTRYTYLPRSFSAMHFFPMVTKASARHPTNAFLPSFCFHKRSKAFALSRLQQ